MISEKSIFSTVDKLTRSVGSYSGVRKKLENLPAGYRLVFGFHIFDADLCNGGAYQTRANGTWAFVVDAYTAAELTGQDRLAGTIKELVYYYHRKNQSRVARQIPENFFAGIPKRWNRSLDALETQYMLKLDRQRAKVVPTLVKKHQSLFADS